MCRRPPMSGAVCSVVNLQLTDVPELQLGLGCSSRKREWAQVHRGFKSGGCREWAAGRAERGRRPRIPPPPRLTCGNAVIPLRGMAAFSCLRLNCSSQFASQLSPGGALVSVGVVSVSVRRRPWMVGPTSARGMSTPSKRVRSWALCAPACAGPWSRRLSLRSGSHSGGQAGGDGEPGDRFVSVRVLQE